MIPHVHWLSTISAHLPAYYALAAGNARPCTCERASLTHNARAFVCTHPSLLRLFPLGRFLLRFSVSSAHTHTHTHSLSLSLCFSDLCVADIFDVAVENLFITIKVRGRREFGSSQCWKTTTCDLDSRWRCGLQQRNSTNAITASWNRIFGSDCDECCRSACKVNSTDNSCSAKIIGTFKLLILVKIPSKRYKYLFFLPSLIQLHYMENAKFLLFFLYFPSSKKKKKKKEKTNATIFDCNFWFSTLY